MYEKKKSGSGREIEIRLIDAMYFTLFHIAHLYSSCGQFVTMRQYLPSKLKSSDCCCWLSSLSDVPIILRNK